MKQINVNCSPTVSVNFTKEGKHFLAIKVLSRPSKSERFFYSLIFTLNHGRPKMLKFDISVKKNIETIFFKCYISLRFRQLGLLES
jgi:hypothetical protein